MDNLNTNIDDYSNQELFDLAELNPESDKNQIEDHFTKIIQGYMGNNDYKMAQFFHDAKEKILNNLDNIDDPTKNQDELDDASNWLKSNYRNPVNKNQEDKITDRRHTIGIFNDNTRPTMSQKRLGISNTIPLEYSQDSLNPTLRQTMLSNIYIDSSDRENTIPFINNPTDNNSSTNFLINLTEPLKNVLSIKLESINIPKSINAFDSFYDNNSMLIYAVEPSGNSIEYFNEDVSRWGIPTRIHLTSGTYDSPIQFINQFNLDLSHCAPRSLKSNGSSSTNDNPPYPGNLQLQAHLVDGLNNNPRIVFINTSSNFVKIRFYQPKFSETDQDISNCLVASNVENRNIQNSSCALYSSYKNNLGYLMGYRIWRNSSSNKIYNSDNSGNTLEIDLSDGSGNTLLLNNIYNNLGALGVSYTMTQYSRDIYNIINIDSVYNNQTFQQTNFYNLSTVPLDLTPTKYIYLCINDFQQNRSSGTIIRSAVKSTKLSLPSYANKSRIQAKGTQQQQIQDLSADIICDTNPNNIGNGDKLYVPSFPRKFTLNQIYALNMINANNRKKNISETSNNITDSIATIPFENSRRIANVSNVFSARKYFGPVKIERLQIQLKNENGNFVNLNGANWGFNLIIEQLYQY